MAERAKTDKVDLNTASRDELVAVPGIGDAAADAIVKYRKEHDGFSSVNELVNVAGIGETTLEGLKAHVTASRKGTGGDKPAAAEEAGKAGAEALQRAERSTAEATQRAARETAGVAREATERGAEVARRTGAAVASGYEQLPNVGREGAEEMARAGHVAFERTSELSRVWMSFWNEQLTDGMQAMRALAGCRTWQEALEVQNEFTRASFERAWSHATKSAELTADLMAGGFRPMHLPTPPNVAAFPRRVA